MMKGISDQWWNKHCEEVVDDTILTDSVLPIRTSGNAPLVFNIKSIPGKYIDTSRIKFHLRWHASKKIDNSWTGIANKDMITVVNNLHHYMFEELLVYANGDLIESTGLTYGMVSYLKNLLYATDQEKQTHLKSAYWYPDVFDTDIVINDRATNFG